MTNWYRDIITLLEGREAPLFHFTSLGTLSEFILPQNLLKANTPNADIWSDTVSVSLTRDFRTPYHKDMGAVLILDQTKLSNSFKMVPLKGDGEENEYEERIYRSIPNLNKYLLAIGISLDINGLYDKQDAYEYGIDRYKKIIEQRVKNINKFVTYSDKYHIPIVHKKDIKSNGTYSSDITDQLRAFVYNEANMLAEIESLRDSARENLPESTSLNDFIAYHATKNNIEHFYPFSHFGTLTAAKQRGRYLFGDNFHIYKVRLNIQNPLKVTDMGASDEAALLNYVIRNNIPNIDIGLARKEGIVTACEKAGYDGLVYNNRLEDRGKLSWVIFHPSQAKIL